MERYTDRELLRQDNPASGQHRQRLHAPGDGHAARDPEGPGDGRKNSDLPELQGVILEGPDAVVQDVWLLHTRESTGDK